jgi:hypothetical protein
MGFSTFLRHWVNLPLAKFNLRFETLTASKLEKERIRKLIDGGYFERPAFPILDSFVSFDGRTILDEYVTLRDECDRLVSPSGNLARYNPVNDYFAPADACPTYLIARIFKPKVWFEIGSGNSTKVVRQAIEDGKLATTLVCVDPHPRTDITAVADEFIRSEAQSLQPTDICDRLDSNDVLFIDSSHALTAGGDVCYLLLNVVPQLRPGVLVHIHDVFLPYEYPREWIELGWSWSEQYLVQAMLQFGPKFEVIWPGYYVQKSRPEIASRLDFLKQGRPASLWLRILEA